MTMSLIRKPPPRSAPSVTSAVTSRDRGVWPAVSSTLARLIDMHDECAAAISSSGLVWPSGLPARVGKDTGNSPALEESRVTVPVPERSPPSQRVVALRVVMNPTLADNPSPGGPEELLER